MEAEDFLNQMIEPTDLTFRMKVKAKDGLYTYDIESKTLSQLLSEFSQQKNQSVIEELERLEMAYKTLTEQSDLYFNKLQKSNSELEYKEIEMLKLESLSKWISVDEKLPKDDERILFVDNYPNNTTRIHKGVFLEKDQWKRENMFCDGSFYPKETITHWMLLPEPPKI